MFVNLSDVLTTEGKVEKLEIPLEMTVFSNGTESFDILEKSPVSIVLANTAKDEARAEGRCSLSFRAACDRCLSDTAVAMEIEFSRTFVSPEADASDEDAEDNRRLMDGYQLDAEALMYDEIVVNWPVKILCREDCKGVCPVCGQNLNERECGCDTFVPDPRMAAIKDIFNADKEV